MMRTATRTTQTWFLFLNACVTKQKPENRGGFYDPTQEVRAGTQLADAERAMLPRWAGNNATAIVNHSRAFVVLN
jgi:hypothetical protein